MFIIASILSLTYQVNRKTHQCLQHRISFINSTMEYILIVYLFGIVNFSIVFL